MNYCLVINNQIIDGPRQLPQNSENVSNFNLLSDEELKIYGWLPYTLIDNKVENQILVESNVEILENGVVETKIYREMTQEEIKEKNDKIITNKWKTIRNKRNGLLRTSDWTQLDDSPINKTLWVSYRNELRNLPQNFSDPDSVVWPTPPSLG